jgi:hypothetical protein
MHYKEFALYSLNSGTINLLLKVAITISRLHKFFIMGSTGLEPVTSCL